MYLPFIFQLKSLILKYFAYDCNKGSVLCAIYIYKHLIMGLEFERDCAFLKKAHIKRERNNVCEVMCWQVIDNTKLSCL